MTEKPQYDRRYRSIDHLLLRLHERLSSLAATSGASAPSEQRQVPGAELEQTQLGDDDRKHAAGLMRVNHAGEVAAQALYQGQALVARKPALRRHLLQAAAEERSHLQWCEQRLRELEYRPSKLNPMWYAGSFAIGVGAGLAGDRWSLGFVAETEKQVAEHLEDYIERLPEADARSRAVLERMCEDERRHGRRATELGGVELPRPVRSLMRHAAQLMKRTAYRI
jgi:ubiquinone biosynthesis monooxygenase Coq7